MLSGGRDVLGILDLYDRHMCVRYTWGCEASGVSSGADPNMEHTLRTARHWMYMRTAPETVYWCNEIMNK